MENKNVNLTIVFNAGSLNYGESDDDNISNLKKYHQNGKEYSFVSRQSIRYSIVKLAHEIYGWDLDTVDIKQKVVQFSKDKTIIDSEEMDLFGYMKTAKKGEGGSQKRAAVVRLNPAYAMFPFNNDLDFLNNMGLASRIGEPASALTRIEMDRNLYIYNINIDLQNVGIDGKTEIDPEAKYRRVEQLLEITKGLYRDIKGRRESLSPVLIIGGVYDHPVNPITTQNILTDRFNIDKQKVNNMLNKHLFGESISEKSYIGTIGFFTNEDELENTVSLDEFYNTVEDNIRNYYLGE